jgi:glycosyltransferase involved in cell wall biosynthesis
MSRGSILMVVSDYRVSGHQTVINNLCRGLYEIGYNVGIGAFSFNNDLPDNIERVNLKRLRSLESNRYNNSKYDFDIIHNHHPKMNYYSFLTQKPFILHYHGASNRIQKVNLRVSSYLCRKRLSKIIGISHAALIDLRNIVGEYNFSALPPPVTINCGVDTKYYHMGLPRPHKKGDPQLLFVGNMYTHKNILRMIRAIPEIAKFYPDVHFQIIGNGDEYQKLEKDIKKKD